jgi:hypothetical protein
MHTCFNKSGLIYEALCNALSSPTSRRLLSLLSDNELSFSKALRIPSRSNQNATSFAEDYLLNTYLDKYPAKVKGVSTKDVALAGFMSDESYNRETEVQLDMMRHRVNSPMLERHIWRIQRKIAHVLGPFDISRLYDGCFGSGASFSLKRREAGQDKKYIAIPQVTSDALKHARRLFLMNNGWRESLSRSFGIDPLQDIEIVKGNKFDTVPKNLRTDRTIAKEPILNGYLQQGAHLYMRNRLRRFGVDLRDQSLNSKKAALAYHQDLATIDLKSASNSVTTELVYLLLPYDWAEYLDDIRSKWTLLPDGSWHQNSMFSSMGNAFTFELETLIFWAIASFDKEVAVYGDDIVVTQKNADEVVRLLRIFGFRINEDKSFLTGPFFESCGKHYFEGFDVTPAYQKEPLKTPSSYVRCYNRLYRWSLRIYGLSPADTPLSSVLDLIYQLAVDAHPRLEGLFGPLISGDRYFLTDKPYLFTSRSTLVQDKWTRIEAAADGSSRVIETILPRMEVRYDTLFDRTSRSPRSQIGALLWALDRSDDLQFGTTPPQGGSLYSEVLLPLVEGKVQRRATTDLVLSRGYCPVIASLIS